MTIIVVAQGSERSPKVSQQPHPQKNEGWVTHATAGDIGDLVLLFVILSEAKNLF
jgi:hypothetical protein